jgi:hypothetical protein
MLQKKEPEPLVRSGPRSKTEWISTGQVVFREMDVAPFEATIRT